MNSTGNFTEVGASPSSCGYPQRTEAARIAKIFAYSFIMLVAFVGNSLVIAVVYKNRHMRRTINYFIVNISVSDLLIPIVVLPRILVELILETPTYAWLLSGKLGVATCKMVYFLSDISPMVSILSLIAMTVDRFCAVAFPLRVGLITSRRRYILILTTWIISVLFTSPLLYGMKLRTFKLPNLNLNVCALDWSPAFDHFKAQKAYTTASSIFFLVIPFVILTVLYSVILIKARARSDIMRHRSVVGRRSEQQASRRLTVMALSIVFVFGFCWGPINFLLFLIVFVWHYRIPTFCGWQAVVLTVQFLAYSNAAINPCIYFLLVKSYRQGLKNIFQCHRSRTKRSNPYVKTTTTDTLRIRLRRTSELENTIGKDESTIM